jgi:protein TonB
MLTLLLLTALTVSLPKLQEGPVPSEPISGREGAFAILEVHVSAAGTVEGAVEVGGAAPIAQLMRESVVNWRFEPARNESDEAVGSKVLLVVVTRAPALGGSVPPLPKAPRPAEASSEIPFPERIPMPELPPQARFPGVVLLEVEIGEEGEVASARVARSSDSFDGVALDTIKSWKFAPATRNGTPIPARAYVLFSFRPPLRLR